MSRSLHIIIHHRYPSEVVLAVDAVMLLLPQLSRVSTICLETRVHDGMYTLNFSDEEATTIVSTSYERFHNIALPSLTSLEHVSLILADYYMPWVQTLNVLKVWRIMKTVELRFTEDLGGDEVLQNLHNESIAEGPFKMQRFTLDVPATFRPEQWTTLFNLCAPLFPNLRELHLRSSRPYPKGDLSSFLVRVATF